MGQEKIRGVALPNHRASGYNLVAVSMDFVAQRDGVRREEECADSVGSSLGAREVLENQYDKFFKILVRYAFFRGMPDPQGFAHDVLILFLKKFDPARKTRPEAFLWRLARDMAVTEWRAMKRHSTTELDEERYEDRRNLPDVIAIAAQLMERLKADEREAVEMWLVGLRPEEMSLEWDCSVLEATRRVSDSIAAALRVAGGKWETVDVRQREAIAMWLSGVGYQEMAKVWACSEAAAKMRVWRAARAIQARSVDGAR